MFRKRTAAADQMCNSCVCVCVTLLFVSIPCMYFQMYYFFWPRICRFNSLFHFLVLFVTYKLEQAILYDMFLQPTNITVTLLYHCVMFFRVRIVNPFPSHWRAIRTVKITQLSFKTRESSIPIQSWQNTKDAADLQYDSVTIMKVASYVETGMNLIH